jgi:hypothetical protein
MSKRPAGSRPGRVAKSVVFPDNRGETAGERCGAKTPARTRCMELPVPGRTRCRLHGGASTGPKTPEGRRCLALAGRERYIAVALADGWVKASDELRRRLESLKESLRGSHNATATALGVSRHAVRRVLTGLPSSPEELHLVERALRRAQFSTSYYREDPYRAARASEVLNG